MKSSLMILAVLWLAVIALVGAISYRQAMAQSLLSGTSNSKMRANPLTGQIYAVGSVITPSPTPTAAPTNTPAPTPTP